MFKRGGGPSYAWRERFFVLLRNKKELWYFKDIKDKAKGKFKGCISLHPNFFKLVKVYEDKEKQFAFALECVDPTARTFHFACFHQSDKDRWIEEILAALHSVRQSTIVGDLPASLQEIRAQDLVISTVILGKGATGVVKKGVWQNTIDVAIKCMATAQYSTEEDKVSFKKELLALSKLRHPFVLQV